MNILDKYLLELDNLDTTMVFKLSKYDVITFTSLEDISKGMLRYDKPPKGKCCLFILPNEQIAEFHTIGMKFPIDIFFYSDNGKLDSSHLNCRPGIRSIKSKDKVKYVIEIPSEEKG
jgi:uncharacterized membrane protein (UPF0127 family)